MIHSRRVVLCVAGVCAGLWAMCSVAAAGSSWNEAALFSPEAFLAHVQYLASDELEGRLAGSEGGRLTAEYVAGRFAEIGLRPAGVEGTYFQPFEVRTLKEFDGERAYLAVLGLPTSPQTGEDWTPMPFTALGDMEGPLAFAGFCIEAPEHGYDDFEGFDATGKVLLALRGEPTAEDPGAAFGGSSPSSHALFSSKARAAAAHGAVGLLIVNDRERSEPDELYGWRVRDARTTYALPMAHISRRLAELILREAGMPGLEALEEELESCRPRRSCDLPGMYACVEMGTARVYGRNVLGLLEGDGSSDEIIIVGAHHDHLGKVPRSLGRGGDPEIHNGADDNASGTAGVIELARALACGPALRRSVLFMTFDAEELGLLGSRYFVANPTVDLSQVAAMINFDMIGRVCNENLTIFGTASGDAFGEVLARAAEQTGLLYYAPQSAGSVFRQSDHASFYDEGIPVMFACTMLHPQYHQPEDDWELVDAEGAVRLIETMSHVVATLADAERAPAFALLEDDRSRGRSARAARTTGDSQDEPAGSPNAMPRVRLGIMPSYGDSGPGLLVETVVPRTPAAVAGMKDGDRIVRIGRTEVTDIYGYMAALREIGPGGRAEVVVQRGGERVTLQVQFTAGDAAGG